MAAHLQHAHAQRGQASWGQIVAQTHCAEGRQGINATAPPLCTGGGWGGPREGIEPEAAQCGKTKRLHPWCTTCATHMESCQDDAARTQVVVGRARRAAPSTGRI